MTLTKAFDFAALMSEVKAQGLPIVEADVKILTKVIFDWAQQSCALEGGFAALGAPLFPMVLAQVIALEDKIDGVVTPPSA